mmetsp:Transcript_159555/g.488253  ORF Transcript_159555/g.488253 Transcript_159555/m.488253 type:complete len:223 (+) Transcript_159555:205-873(+)
MRDIALGGPTFCQPRRCRGLPGPRQALHAVRSSTHSQAPRAARPVWDQERQLRRSEVHAAELRGLLAPVSRGWAAPPRHQRQPEHLQPDGMSRGPASPLEEGQLHQRPGPREAPSAASRLGRAAAVASCISGLRGERAPAVRAPQPPRRRPPRGRASLGGERRGVGGFGGGRLQDGRRGGRIRQTRGPHCRPAASLDTDRQGGGHGQRCGASGRAVRRQRLR